MTEKEIPKGQGPKAPARQESQTSRHATIFNGGNAKMNPTWRDKCVFKHTGKRVTTKLVRLLPYIWKGPKNLTVY